MADDNNTTPLINTIRETTLAAIAKKYNIETAQKRFYISHSQSDSEYITGAIGEYNDAIDEIIDNIPDVPPTPPDPTLPTIWQSRANVSPSNQTISVGGISLLSRDGQIIQYYSDYSYAFRRWVKFTTTDRSPGEIISNAGSLAVKNTGTSDVTGVYNVDYAACSNNQAEVVTVYDNQNASYNAFKFNSNGTDYYYVLDEVQTVWTDDLSSIGYSLTPAIVLPTVSISGDFGTNLFKFNTLGSDYTFNAGVTTSIYRYDTGAIETYNQSKNYATVRCINAASQIITRTGVELVNWNGNLWCHNISGSTLVVAYIKVAVCSSNEATVITVYNSSNEAFNAFKYTASGTDYYYVLDGTQTDWTDDLSSIGYHLQAEYIDVFLYLYYDGRSCTFGARDYWGSFIIDNEDKAALENFGISIVTVTSSGAITATAEAVSYANNDQFTLEILGLYTGVRTGDAVADLSNFNIDRGPSNQPFYYPQNCIWSINAYNTSVKTWKCRITKKTT